LPAAPLPRVVTAVPPAVNILAGTLRQEVRDMEVIPLTVSIPIWTGNNFPSKEEMNERNREMEDGC
jgi:hypothetical protein